MIKNSPCNVGLSEEKVLLIGDPFLLFGCKVSLKGRSVIESINR